MQTVDLVIGGLGVVAVIATTLGVVFYEEAAGEQTVIFPEGTVQEFSESDSGGAGTYEFPVSLPNNATAATGIVVTISFTGTQSALADDSAGSYEVRITPPNGTCPPEQTSWSTSAEISLDDCRWAEPPASVESTDAGSVDETLTWEEDLIVEVIISNPSDQTQLPTVSYTYDIDVELDVLGYAATVASPDVDTL